MTNSRDPFPTLIPRMICLHYTVVQSNNLTSLYTKKKSSFLSIYLIDILLKLIGKEQHGLCMTNPAMERNIKGKQQYVFDRDNPDDNDSAYNDLTIYNEIVGCINKEVTDEDGEYWKFWKILGIQNKPS